MTTATETPDEMTGSFLTFTGVQKRFGDMVAVHGFDLEIGRGDFVAIMGPSGCGKTTTLRMLAGLETPTAGQICRDGVSINETPPWQRRMPLVWQNYALFPFLSVLDNVAFGLRNDDVGKAERHRRSQAWLERLGIGDLAHRTPDTLSGGQAQRVALARALVLEPEILLLDEPLSALDANMVVRMQTEIAELQRALGITFIYVTHNQSEAFAMADRVVIMNEGEIQQVGTPMDVYRAPRTRFVADFVGTNNIVEGVVRLAPKDKCTVVTKLGEFVSSNPSNTDIAAGANVHLVVSADLVSVSRSAKPGKGNTVAARLVGESFVGNMVTLVFEAGDGQEFKVQLQQRALQDLKLRTGDEITLTFDPMDTLIIPAA